jgi:Uncharacterized protein conserved in archaea
MNLDELRSAQAKERRKDSLQHLRDAFYDDVAGYVADLRAARDRRAEQVKNPSPTTTCGGCPTRSRPPRRSRKRCTSAASAKW